MCKDTNGKKQSNTDDETGNREHRPHSNVPGTVLSAVEVSVHSTLPMTLRAKHCDYPHVMDQGSEVHRNEGACLSSTAVHSCAGMEEGRGLKPGGPGSKVQALPT